MDIEQIVLSKMKWLLSALIAVGTLTVLGLMRPWNALLDSTSQTALSAFIITIGITIWVLLPMVSGWVFLSCNKHPFTRTLLVTYVVSLLLLWSLSAIITTTDTTFDSHLGLFFWPVLEWIGLFGIFVVWGFENASAPNPKDSKKR